MYMQTLINVLAARVCSYAMDIRVLVLVYFDFLVVIVQIECITLNLRSSPSRWKPRPSQLD